MIVRTTQGITGTERDVATKDWRSKRIVLADDGVGWSGRCGDGLQGLSRRIAEAGGRLEILAAEPETGTVVRVHTTSRAAASADRPAGRTTGRESR